MKPKITPTGTELLKEGGAPTKKIKPETRQIKTKVIEAPPKAAPAPEPTPEIPPLKVAIIGTAPSSRDLAPFSDPSWQIWACSPGNMGILPRTDIWFEVHSNLLWPENQKYGVPYIEWLKKQSFPIYMQDNSLVPNAQPLPINDLVREFGKYFFTSSFAYMIAMAIRAGAKEIALFGVDMASKDEYILQRAGGQYFMQEAAKRGISVHVPLESDLAQPPPLYGYEMSTPFGRKLQARRKEISERIAILKNQTQQSQNNQTYLEGALEDLDYMQSIFGGLQT